MTAASLAAMKKAREPVYAVLRTVLASCPICGEAWPQDRRYRRRAVGMTLRVHRLSPRSAKMACRVCGLRFSVTLQILARAMDSKAAAEPDHGARERWQAWAAFLRGVAAPGRPGRAAEGLTPDTPAVSS